MKQYLLWASDIDETIECEVCGKAGARTAYFHTNPNHSHYDPEVPAEVLCNDCINRTISE